MTRSLIHPGPWPLCATPDRRAALAAEAFEAAQLVHGSNADQAMVRLPQGAVRT